MSKRSGLGIVVGRSTDPSDFRVSISVSRILGSVRIDLRVIWNVLVV